MAVSLLPAKTSCFSILRVVFVSSILAKDGDRLEKGQIVLEIAPEVTKAELARLQARFSLLTAQKARFEAEKGSASAGTEKGRSIQAGPIASPQA